MYIAILDLELSFVTDSMRLSSVTSTQGAPETGQGSVSRLFKVTQVIKIGSSRTSPYATSY